MKISAVLKDVPSSPLEMLRNPDNDQARMNFYPNLDYKGLYNAISQLVDVASLVQYGVQGQCFMSRAHIFGTLCNVGLFQLSDSLSCNASGAFCRFWNTT